MSLSEQNSQSSASSRHNRIVAYILLVLTALFWGVNANVAKLAIGEISPLMLSGLRWIGTMLVMLVFAHRHIRDEWPQFVKALPMLMVAGGIGLAGFNGLLYSAALSTTVLNIALLQAAIPVFVIVGAYFMYQTVVTWRQMMGVVLAIFGVVIVATRGDLSLLLQLEFNVGDMLMIIACMAYAAYTLFLRNRPALSTPAFFAGLSMGACVVGIAGIFWEVQAGAVVGPTLLGWGMVLFTILLPTLVSQVLFIFGVRRIGPGRAGLFINLVPIFAGLGAIFFLNEQLQIFHAIALVLVFGGIFLAEVGKQAEN